MDAGYVDTSTGGLLRAGDVVRMIILLSKADRVVIHRRCWWSVVLVSLIHALTPIMQLFRSSCLQTQSDGIMCTDSQYTEISDKDMCHKIDGCQFRDSFTPWLKLDNWTAAYPYMDCTLASPGCYSCWIQPADWLVLVFLIVALLCFGLALFNEFRPEQETALHRAAAAACVGTAFLITAGVGHVIQDRYCSHKQFWVIVFVATTVSAIAFGVIQEFRQQSKLARISGAIALLTAAAAVFVLLQGVGIHLASFCVNYWLTYSVTIRMSNCYEDVYERYRRMLYFLHTTPWPTLKRTRKVPHFGLLPEFGLASVNNIETWNKM